MTTVFGAAIPCRRAARLGVSPTTPRSWGLPGADEIADYDAQVNAIFDKAITVLGHPELFEPVLNLLHRDHQGDRRPQHREFTPVKPR